MPEKIRKRPKRVRLFARMTGELQGPKSTFLRPASQARQPKRCHEIVSISTDSRDLLFEARPLSAVALPVWRGGLSSCRTGTR